MITARSVQRCWIFACVLGALSTGAAQPSVEDDEPKKWVEIEAPLPPYPKAGNLLELDAGAASINRFFIDGPSIAIGADGVVRYTLVVRTAGGAENISFEGIRCETREQKSYAFGRRDGAWSKPRVSEWRRIEYKDRNRHHGTLFANYFCYDRTVIRSQKEAIQRLKYGPPSRTDISD